LNSSEHVTFLQSRDVTRSHMSETLQTRTSKRISHLLRPSAHSESVKITPHEYYIQQVRGYFTPK